MSTPAAAPAKRVNLRTPDVMAAVQAQVESDYRSAVVEKLRATGGTLSLEGLTIRLAKQFGFCYGVERAIDLAYAAAKVFPDQRRFILGEIIHNPEVNEQIAALGIRNLLGPDSVAMIDDLTANDVVIVPAFGTDVGTLARIKERGCQIVDTTCGDVMSVWKRCGRMRATTSPRSSTAKPRTRRPRQRRRARCRTARGTTSWCSRSPILITSANTSAKAVIGRPS
jgi:4-hydroxy-3-methylbut-2-enyl diphosphate reductase